VNGAVPTTIIVAGLALAGYALLMTALNRRMGISLLAALGVLEILLLVLIGIIVAMPSGRYDGCSWNPNKVTRLGSPKDRIWRMP
jgi:hypothetical protein